MRSAIVTIFSPCLWQYAARSSARAIVPSSFCTSQITPAGISPASRARSTLASVWPVRSSTPPDRAFNGCTCPPTTMSPGPLPGSIAVCIVCAWSWTLMPVVTPSRASMVTVNGVWCGVSFLAAMSSRPSSSQRSGVSARQIHPPAWRVMKLMASGVMNCAAITRSPSFSRSSSSTTTTILPAAMSSRASSMVANSISVRAGNELLHMLGQDVHFQVDGSPLSRPAQRGSLQRLGDERHREPVVAEVGDRERDAVDRDRALLDDVAQQRRIGVDDHDPREALLAHLAHDPEAVDVALDNVAAEPVGGTQRQLEVDGAVGLERAERRAAERLGHHVGAEQLAAAHPAGGEADAVDGDRVALAQLTGERRLDAEAHAVARLVDAMHGAEVLDETGEHSRHHSLSRALTSRSSPIGSQSSVSARTASAMRSTPPPSTASRDLRPPMIRGARNRRASSISPASKNAPARCGPPSSRIEVTSRWPSWSSAERTRACSFSPAATSTSAPAVSSDSVSWRGAARETTTVSGISGAAWTSWLVSGRRASESKTIRRGWRWTPSTRAVSCGSSATAVPIPTATASTAARQRCASVRLASQEIHLESPVAVATLPSSVIADLNSTHGRPVRACLRNAWLPSRARVASSPSATMTSTPSSRRIPRPRPAAFSVGSSDAITTRVMPAARIASVHGGVRPVCAHGSSDTYIVAPAVSAPAQAASAARSAWGPPRSAWKPSPSTCPSLTTTAPTSGLGLTRPRPP